jgi:hypothetical protein
MYNGPYKLLTFFADFKSRKPWWDQYRLSKSRRDFEKEGIILKFNNHITVYIIVSQRC